MSEPEDKPTFGQASDPDNAQQPSTPGASQQDGTAAPAAQMPAGEGAAGTPQDSGASQPAEAEAATAAASTQGSPAAALESPAGQTPVPPPSPYADELPQTGTQPFAPAYGQPYTAYPPQDGTQPYAAYPGQDGTQPYAAYPGQDAANPYGQAPYPYQQPYGSGQAAGTQAPGSAANPYYGQPMQPDGAANPYYGQPAQPDGATQQQNVAGAQGAAPQQNVPGAQGAAQPYQPYAQGTMPQPPYPGQGGYPPYGGQPPYPYQPYPAAPVPPKKRKVWPWVLVAILVVFVLGIGGCVSCVACSVAADRDYSSTYDDTYSYDSNSYDYSNGYTLDFIKDLGASLPGNVTDGKCTPGTYQVGKDKDIEPGLYYLEGSQTEEGSYFLFTPGTEAGHYNVAATVSYFGNYYAQLDEGDVIVFWGSGNSSLMYTADQAPAAAQAPYPSGCYRVGTDIPAGTYTVTIQEGASSIEASQEAAAYSMKDLEFGSDSIVDTKYVIAGSSQTITLTDGQYLELYLAVATPA